MDLRLLEASCLFCGYNGTGYWQAGTHAEGCPWHHVGGIVERAERLPGVVAALRDERDQARGWAARWKDLAKGYREVLVGMNVFLTKANEPPAPSLVERVFRVTRRAAAHADSIRRMAAGATEAHKALDEAGMSRDMPASMHPEEEGVEVLSLADRVRNLAFDKEEAVVELEQARAAIRWLRGMSRHTKLVPPKGVRIAIANAHEAAGGEG